MEKHCIVPCHDLKQPVHKEKEDLPDALAGYWIVPGNLAPLGYCNFPHCEDHKRDEVALEGDILLYLCFHPSLQTDHKI